MGQAVPVDDVKKLLEGLARARSGRSSYGPEYGVDTGPVALVDEVLELVTEIASRGSPRCLSSHTGTVAAPCGQADLAERQPLDAGCSNAGTIQRVDPTTSTVTATIAVRGFEPTELAPPGLWAVSDGLVAFDRMALAPAVRVPLVRTDARLAGGFGSVWVLDIELGVVTRVRADLQPRPEGRKT